MKMQMDELLTYFQSSLEKDFVYDSDTVIEQLQICMEELKKARMTLPPKPKINEQPTLPFGLEIQPSVEQLIGRRGDETMDEHFRKNAQRPSGKAAYLRRKKSGGSLTGGANLLSTPEMTRSRGGDIRSLHSRISQYSLDEKSSQYDTATNSRMSLTDYSAKNSAPSSRTSFGESSEMGSMPALGHGFTTPVDLDDVGMEVSTPTTPTNLFLPSYKSPHSAQTFEQPKISTSSNHQGTTTSSDTWSQSPNSSAEQTQRVVYERSPRPGSVSQNTARTVQTTSYHSSPTTPTKYEYHRNTNNMKGSRSYEYDYSGQSVQQGRRPQHQSTRIEKQIDMTKSSSPYEMSTQYSASPEHILPVTVAVSDGQKFRDDDVSRSQGSPSSDYDNIDYRYIDNSKSRFSRGHNVTQIPISKSEGYMSSIGGPTMVLLNGDDKRLPTKMKGTRTENDIQRASQQDHRKHQNFANGIQMEYAKTGQTRKVYARDIEKTSHL